jgi:hypothetical protein
MEAITSQAALPTARNVTPATFGDSFSASTASVRLAQKKLQTRDGVQCRWRCREKDSLVHRGRAGRGRTGEASKAQAHPAVLSVDDTHSLVVVSTRWSKNAIHSSSSRKAKICAPRFGTSQKKKSR